MKNNNPELCLVSKIPQLRIKAILNNSKNEILFFSSADNLLDPFLKLPEGLIRYGEAPEIGLKRIILDCINIEVEPLAFLGIYTQYNGIDSKNSYDESYSITIVFVCLVLDLQNVINTTENILAYLRLDKKARGSEFLTREENKKF